jgi:hypothetical protein
MCSARVESNQIQFEECFWNHGSAIPSIEVFSRELFGEHRHFKLSKTPKHCPSAPNTSFHQQSCYIPGPWSSDFMETSLAPHGWRIIFENEKIYFEMLTIKLHSIIYTAKHR